MEADPGSVAVFENNNLLGSLLVIVTNMSVDAAPFSNTLAVVSRPWPTMKLAGINPAGFTATVKVLAPAAGRLRPAGERGVAVKVALPVSTAVNCVVAFLFPPVIVTGDDEIVATVVFELSTLTLADVPPLRG